jgi:hypothetical protein
MKFILEFDETESYEHEVCCKSLDILLLLDNLDSEIRSALRKECGEFAKLDVETLEKIRDWVWEQRHFRNIPELK